METYNYFSIKKNINNITMFTGIPKYKWYTIWKNKNLINKLTNVTSDEDFALDYSYNFKTGKYENTIVKISNIPIDAFIAYRNDDYIDDDDFYDMENMTIENKLNIIENKKLFLVDLYTFKNKINTELIEF